jgi:preprotein translocase subunit YajC
MNSAYAMGAPGGGGGAAGGDFSFIIMMAVLFGIFYFLMIRPQQKKQKEIKNMIANLAHGDLVIADKVKIKVARNFIGAVLQKAT